MAKKPRDTEEDTNRTKAEVPEVVQATRDDEIDDEAQQGNLDAAAGEQVTSEASGEDDSDQLIIEENLELEPEDPEVAEIMDFEDMADPRLSIAKKHDEKHRQFGEPEEEDVEIEAAAAIIDDDDEPEMVEVTVYGDTRMVEKSKVDKAGGLQNYQKQLAVDEGFQANAQQKASLEVREGALAERERKVQVQEAAIPTLDSQHGQPADPPLPGDQNIAELATKYQEAVYDGDESAPKLLAELVTAAARPAAPNIDVEAIKLDAADEFERRARQKKVVKATRALVDEHPELDRKKVEFDPRLFTAIDDETTVIERQQPDLEPEEVMAEAWKRVSAWRGGHKTDTMNDKAAAKRQMARPRVSGGKNFKPPIPPAKTASDYVNDVKRSRGQL